MTDYFLSGYGTIFDPHAAVLGGHNPREFQNRVNVAYGAAGLTPFKVHDTNLIPHGDQTIPHPDKVAQDLIATSIECRSDADYDEALNEALELYQRATAWEALKKSLSAPGVMGKSTRQLFIANMPSFRQDLAPAVEATLANIAEAAGKLSGVDNPFNNDEVVSSRANISAVHALITGLSTLGQLSAIYTVHKGADEQNRFKPRQLQQLLMYVKLEDPSGPMYTDRSGVIVTPADPIAESVHQIQTALRHTDDVRRGNMLKASSERWQYLDLDLMLFYIARGDIEGLSLEYTTDDAELSRRTAALEAATTPVVMSPEQYYRETPGVSRPKRMPKELHLNPVPRDPATRAFSR